VLIAMIAWLSAGITYAAELQKFSGVTLVKDAYHDGDSFRVKLADRELTIRLYFVDTPETSVSHSTDARRVRSQKRYFGLSSARDTMILYGRRASVFAGKKLSRPFTLYTSFAVAMGRSRGGRYYGFIETADGEDLGELLVANGLARAYGVSHSGPHGAKAKELSARFHDLESMAMLSHRGVWKVSDAEKLVEMREQERNEAKELQTICDDLNAPIDNLDINRASLEELETLPGVGPVTGQRIIDGRPYKNIEELVNLPGISSNGVKKIRPYLKDI
jgi:DNA uptake protein ComE-like DNA-binding protein